MPGKPHEVLIVAMQEQPGLLGALVAKLKRFRLGRGLRPVESTLRFVKPTELRLDLVMRDDRRAWAIVEVQRGIDWTKRRHWLAAAAVLYDQTKVLGDILVITARKAVARWAKRVAVVRTKLGTKLSLEPVVFHLGAREARALLDPKHPELALFAAWAMHHRHGPEARALVERAFEVTEELPPPLRGTQERAILSVLSDRMVAFLKKASMNPDKIPETRASRQLRLLWEARDQKALAEGEAKGHQAALLVLLRTRALAPSRDDVGRIRACADIAKLERWIARATTATSMREVFGPRSSPPPAPRKAKATRSKTRTARATASRRRASAATKPRRAPARA